MMASFIRFRVCARVCFYCLFLVFFDCGTTRGVTALLAIIAVSVTVTVGQEVDS